MTIQLRVPGALPVSPLRYVQTPVSKGIGRAIETAVRTNSVGAISGPPGVGKTTTSAVEAATHGPVVYVSITSRASSRQNIVSMFEAVTGVPARGTATQVQSDLMDHLMTYPTTMLIDDAHQIGADGLILINGLHNLVRAAQGSGTPIVLVGNDLSRNIAALVPELANRFNGRYDARYLTPQETIDAIHVLEPRTALNDQKMLFDLDRMFFKGELRGWSFFLDNLNLIGGISLDEPYPDRDIKEAVVRAGLVTTKKKAATR